YLQTWHGTPIKKLLWDLPRKKVPVTYRRIMRKEAAQWDLLLAQTHNAAENLKSGLRYDGEIKIGEYPRNVRLNDEMTDPSLIKRRLGIDSAGKVVLYVPTWREADRVDEDSSWSASFNAKEFAEETDSTVLVRFHHMTAKRLSAGKRVV